MTGKTIPRMTYRQWRAAERAKEVHVTYRGAAELGYLKGFNEAIEHSARLMEQLAPETSENLCSMIRAIGTGAVDEEGKSLEI